MSTTKYVETYAYQIDENDIIVRLSDNWPAFAKANYADELCNPANVVGVSLFDFISDAQTRQLYRAVLARVRETGREAIFPFRCDLP